MKATVRSSVSTLDENASSPVAEPSTITAHSPAPSAATAEEAQQEKTVDTKLSSPSILPTSPRPETIRDTPIIESSATPPPAISSPHRPISPGLFEPQSSSAPISTASTPTSDAPPSNNEKPVQLNKGRCFSCRVKIPLAKQTVNKCRCNYTFCDSHRYPDRHDCDFDYAKLGRDLLAKNNPKLNQRPKGGRTFQRIDSL
ncbi:hypothetical protein BC943DRAFT_186748 [Umbelopsis sp. AD052]|nr:hypothetical protein BC943DRAFT_186748 [Umbelopsis sp. AD052]